MPVTDTQGNALFESRDFGASWTGIEALSTAQDLTRCLGPAEAERPACGPASPRMA